jgi:tRNA(Leu) C34 or U34 (ribose-2'-O)-methylase TrmL
MSNRKIGEVILDLRNISLAFGGVKALTDISFDVREHENWDAFVDAEFGPGIAGQTRPSAWLFTTKASMRPHWEGAYQDGDYLLFGSETRGAPDHVHEWVSERFGEHCRVCLPMRPEARSLNLAVSVGVAVYEAQRQLAARVNA